MDEIKQKIKQILKENFDIDADDDQRLFHKLDSINYFRYVIMIEREFQINVENVTFTNIKDTVDYIYNCLNSN
jgi:acyl carrier protein